jgi:glycosidase
MTPFVGSHDSSRMISRADYGSGNNILRGRWSDDTRAQMPARDEPYDRLAIALAWNLTVPGAQLLYYGDEYGEHGGDDPDNRHMWVAPAQRTSRQSGLAARIGRVGKLRRDRIELRRGEYVPLTVTEDVLSFARTYEGQSVIVAINRAGAPRTVQITVPADLASAGALVDKLDPALRTFGVIGGTVSVEVAARSATVLTR